MLLYVADSNLKDNNIMRKTIFIFLLLFCIAINAIAQTNSMSVADFRFVPESTEANTKGTIVKDKNGDKCALIKVQTTIVDLNFDAGLMYVETKQKSGEIWVYVQAGANRLSISHAQLGKIDYPLPMTLQKARVYELDLVANMASGGSLQVSVLPNGADVFLDGKLYGQTPLFISSLVDDYQLEVKRNGYEPISCKIKIDKGEIVSISDTLKRWIKLKVSEQAQIVVDGKDVGLSEWDGYVSLGIHHIETRKNNFSTRYHNISITEKSDSIFQLDAPIPIYGSLSVETFPIGADIKLDDTTIGASPIIVPKVLIGNHRIEISKKDYQSEIISK